MHREIKVATVGRLVRSIGGDPPGQGVAGDADTVEGIEDGK